MILLNKQRSGNRLNQFGFSLIEVLVTMVIVGVGLMGLIALMMKGLQANSGASMRTIATAQAYDIADRMRANIVGTAAGNYSSILPTGSASSSCPIATNANIAPPTSTGSCGACTSACSIADIAARDACMWHEANYKLLPKGSGAVCKSAANNWYSIYVSWDDNKSGNTDKTFILRFEP